LGRRVKTGFSIRRMFKGIEGWKYDPTLSIPVGNVPLGFEFIKVTGVYSSSSIEIVKISPLIHILGVLDTHTK
jgi:hypothetical protein